VRAWQVVRHGEPESALELVDVPRPEPGPTDVRVTVAAAAVGMPDVFLCRGSYAFSPAIPFTPGQEVCGIVNAAGPHASVATGTRIMGVTRFPDGHGGFAEDALVGADSAFRVPDAMSDVDAAAFPIGWSTAWVALVRRGQLHAGERLLVLGAAGGSGATAVQLGAALGAEVVAVVGDEAKAAYCRELGAASVVDRRTGDVVDAVLAATGGRGVDVVYDPVGGVPGEQAARALTTEGRFLAVGFAAGRWPAFDVARLVRRNISVLGVYVGAYAPEERAADHEALLDLFVAGRIRTCVTDVRPFTEVPAALATVAAGTVVGKSVVRG
jgi:NADPH:quinone reductase